MAFGNTSTTYDALLKEFYSDGNVENTIYTQNPFLAMIKKVENITGRHYVMPLIYGGSQGASATFGNAQSLASLTGELSVDFLVTRVQQHGIANISMQAVDDSGSDKGAFLKAVSLVADNKLKTLTNKIARSLYGSSDGNMGQVSNSNVGLTVLTLINPKDAIQYSVGMELVVAQSKTASPRALGSNGHGLYVVSVDKKAGKVTIGTSPVPGGTAVALNDAADGIPLIAQNDFIFNRGDQGLKISGFQSWVPNAPLASNDSFFGANRYPDQVAMAGNYLDGTGSVLEEVLEQASADVVEQGGSLTHFLMSPKKFSDLSKSLGSKAQLVDVKVGEFGFSGVKVIGSEGAITCLADRNCPSTMVAGINLPNWKLISSGKLIHIDQADGNVWLRSQTDSGMEIRFRSYAQLICEDPRSQINITVNA